MENVENESVNSFARRYLLTINNETQTDEELIEYVQNLEHFKYCAFQREIGEKEGTEHIQMFIVFSVSKRFNTIKNYFPRAHIEKVKGTNIQARDYCTKSETRVSGPYEIGQFAEERSRTDIKNMYDMLRAGAPLSDIRDLYPNLYLKQMTSISKLQQEFLFDKFKTQIRNLEVTYIYGKAGVGKTSFVLKEHGLSNVYRVTDYKRDPFFSYAGQDVILFDEFDSNFDITVMNNLLDIYPLDLPCRYANKTACYTKVYIISNLPLSRQYTEIQNTKPEQYAGLKRRIHKIYEFTENGARCIKAPNADLIELTEVDEEYNSLPF